MKNPTFQEASDDYYVQEKKFLFHLIPDGPNVVMDLGCGAGRVGKGLLESNKAAEIVGVEIFEPAANEALKCYKTVHVGDIENMDLAYDKHFDVVICGDILEHLKDPFKIVERARHWLKDSGRLVCCVPNVRYWRVWSDLVFRGKWEYKSEGIMDQTHLRFYTRRSFKALLKNASFVVQDEEMRIALGPKQLAVNRVTWGIFEEFLGIQMLFTARKN